MPRRYFNQVVGSLGVDLHAALTHLLRSAMTQIVDRFARMIIVLTLTWRVMAKRKTLTRMDQTRVQMNSMAAGIENS
jgi:hypothetical protein